MFQRSKGDKNHEISSNITTFRSHCICISTFGTEGWKWTNKKFFRLLCHVVLHVSILATIIPIVILTKIYTFNISKYYVVLCHFFLWLWALSFFFCYILAEHAENRCQVKLTWKGQFIPYIHYHLNYFFFFLLLYLLNYEPCDHSEDITIGICLFSGGHTCIVTTTCLCSVHIYLSVCLHWGIYQW